MDIDLQHFLADCPQEQWLEIYDRLIAVNTMLVDPHFPPDATGAEARAVYALNPTVALFSAVGCAANRIAALAVSQALPTGAPGNTATLSYQRLDHAVRFFQPDIAHEAIRLVEAMVTGGLRRGDLHRYAVSAGAMGFMALLFIGKELAHLVVETGNPDYPTPAAIVEREALDWELSKSLT